MFPAIRLSKYPSLWKSGASDRAVSRDQQEFLSVLWGRCGETASELYGALCFRRRGSKHMVQKFERLTGVSNLRPLLREFDRHGWDQYFCPNVFTRPRRLLAYVHRTSLSWCDVDRADPGTFDPTPSVVWRTSPNNTQALWFWDRSHSPIKASAFSKALTYRHGGDKGGSAANKLLRLPGSFNHKPIGVGVGVPPVW